ncbi:TldD/PmbA family protein [Methanobrevibacter curvatus]|uniref:Metalloprotease TldD n=1 Tax=Methanobrevibacter curvatus TaxID=49547 RepID=A0A165ZPF7_9EURY|nr:TldD/PmbA family protein [Methanobrevibacter curvatus]KZX10988.1 metalloprotease TldD [Methanobrevibacter curvatus]
MLMDVVEDLKREILKYSNEYEIYISNTNEIQLDSENETINFAKNDDNYGIGIRILNGNKIGFAYTSDIESYSKIPDKAFLNSKLNEDDENFSFTFPSKYPKVKGLYDKKFNDLEFQEIYDLLEESISTVKDENCQTSSAGFHCGLFKSLVVNSNGVEVSNQSTSFSSHIAVVAEDGGEKSSFYDSLSSTKFDLNVVDLSKNVCKIAIDSIGGEKIDTGDKTVVLDYHAATGLLNTFISGFNGGAVLRGRSILKDKVSEKISSSDLSIYDDGTINGGLMSSTSDSEGTASQKTPLVENGILKGFIYDVYNSNKYNNLDDIDEDKKQLSTGNGFRSYSSVPAPSSSNILFDFKQSVDMEEIRNGIIASDVLGAHTANPISGDFSVEINNPFLIENGEITKPIKKAMISGNIFKVIETVKALKSEVIQKGSFIIPKILCENLRVVGD